jgi:hypothetical protein
VIGLVDTERAELLAELRLERFGRTPWRELVHPSGPPADPRRQIDDPETCAARRRELCIALDGRYTDDGLAPARTVA